MPASLRPRGARSSHQVHGPRARPSRPGTPSRCARRCHPRAWMRSCRAPFACTGCEVVESGTVLNGGAEVRWAVVGLERSGLPLLLGVGSVGFVDEVAVEG